MGRAIDVDKRLDELEFKINEVLLILDELGKTASKQKQMDLHEATKEEKSNDEGNGKRSVKSDTGKSKKSNNDNDSSKRSKWLYGV